jgi:serine/threonine protein kinase
MALDPARVKSLFLAASDIADPAERAVYLNRECGADAQLRARVEALLRANDAAPLPASQPVQATGDYAPDASADGASADPAGEDRAGTVIAGKYTLVELIGEGGMGSVWRAKQTEPVKRFVAVKLIKAGMDSRQVLARFEAERQALALMDHANIAKVLDGGLHEHRPFFVMELVKGVPITDFCDARKLTPKERLELFVPVCQAIQHAHHKGIIHRDIKPSNVLIALYDDKPVVKVIDFGVAKATGGTLTEHTIDTGLGVVVGTPQYMSPEQATFNNLDIDTRTDVYALGVLLYELLTGSPPFARKELQKAGLLEILRVVREEEPPRPSAKLSTADALPTLSANRGTEPKKLTGLLRNELDWIVMKALEKDRVRRYETANGFAADVLRYLGGEAVLAHPPSTAYRLKKFAKRYKGQVVAVSVVLFALVAGIVGTTLGLVEAKKQEAEAKHQEGLALEAAEEERQAKLREAERAEGERQAKLREAERAEGEKAAKLEAQKNLQQAETNLAFAKKGNDILGSVFTGLNPNKNFATVGELSQTLKDNLQKAVQELEGSAIGDSLTVAQMQNTLGLSLLGLGGASQAIILFEKARATRSANLGPDHPDTLMSMNNLAQGYQDAGKLDLALPLYKETLKLWKTKLGPDHPYTLGTMNNLASGYREAGKLDLALPLMKESFKLFKAKLGPDHPETLNSMNTLATGYHVAGKLDLALPLMKETLELQRAKLGPDHSDTLTTMHNLAEGYLVAGELDLALPLMKESFKLFKAKLGPDHPSTLKSMGTLATGYHAAGKLDLALPLMEETLKLQRVKLGPDHPDTLVSMNSLALGYKAAGKLDLALPLYKETLKLMRVKLGPDHPDTLQSMHNLAWGYRAVGKLDLALPLLEVTLKLRKDKLGPDHPDTLNTMNILASGYYAAGKLDLALPLMKETLKLMRVKLGPDHPDTLLCMHNLACGYRAVGKLDRALPLMEETLKRQRAKLRPDHPDTLLSMTNLAVMYKNAGRVGEALPLLEEAFQTAKGNPTLGWVGLALLDAYGKAGKTAEAAKLVTELLADVRKQNPKDNPQLAEMLAQFSLSLLQANAFADAEPLLRECLTIREKTQPDDWSTFNTMSTLGGALLGQKKYAAAEPLLLKGYEGMKQREKTIPLQGATRMPEALDRLIELYTATNKPDQAKKWQAERAKYPAAMKPVTPKKK